MTQELPNWMQNNTYPARLDRLVLDMLRDEGVISGLVVTQRGAGANMSVDIGVGSAIIKGDDQAAQGSYMASTTVLENIAIGAAPGSNSRRDLICYRINDPNATGPAGNNASFVVVAGTAAASPTLPALPTSAIPLAEVLVSSGTVSITNALITSLRSPSVGRDGVWPGSIMPWAGDEASVPASWALCNGQAVNRVTEFGLFRAIGTTWGSGNGTTTFNVPDLRGVTLSGRDNMGGTPANKLTGFNTVGVQTGAETVTLTTTNMPAHVHTMAHTHSIDPPAYNFPESILQVGSGLSLIGTGGVQVHANVLSFNLPAFTSGASSTADTGSIGSGTPHANVQPTAIVNYIIKR